MERAGAQSRGLGRYGGASLATPFGFMRQMMDDMDRLFSAFTGGSIVPRIDEGVWSGAGGAFEPQIDVFERDNKLVVRADLPGVKKEDVRVELTDDGLLLAGERKYEHEETRGGVYTSERRYGSFQRLVPLPRGVDPRQCDASFDDGVLEVSVPVPAETRRQIEVQSRGARSGVEPQAEPGRETTAATPSQARRPQEDGTAPARH